MDEFAIEVVAKGADGSLAPFHIYVGSPQVVDDIESECLAWCSLIERPKWIKGASLTQAYALAFQFIQRLVEYADLTLIDAKGMPFVLPLPPDEFGEEP